MNKHYTAKPSNWLRNGVPDSLRNQISDYSEMIGVRREARGFCSRCSESLLYASGVPICKVKGLEGFHIAASHNQAVTDCERCGHALFWSRQWTVTNKHQERATEDAFTEWTYTDDIKNRQRASPAVSSTSPRLPGIPQEREALRSEYVDLRGLGFYRRALWGTVRP